MKNIDRKIKEVYVPFLLISLSTVVGYTLLTWLVVKQLQWVTPDEDLLNSWIPLGLPWIPLFCWFRPRLRRLRLKTKRKSDLPSLYLLLAGAAIIIPTMVSLSWLDKASGKLTTLTHASQVSDKPLTKYYVINHPFIDKKHIGVYKKVSVSGKNSEHYDMSIYLVVPVLGNVADTNNIECPAWYGIRYHQSISNRKSGEEKQVAFELFSTESQAEFDGLDPYRFTYFTRVGNNNDYKAYQKAIRRNRKYNSFSAIVLQPVNEPFNIRTGKTGFWSFGSFALGAAILLLLVVIPKYNPGVAAGVSAKPSSWRSSFNFILPHEGFFITPVIIYINLFVFGLMVVSGLGFLSFDATDLLSWRGNYPPAATSGDWWRVISCVFVHGGVMHLLSNMYGLFFVGVFLEPIMGKIPYAISYIVTGIMASLCSLYFHRAAVSVGASGAIFGLYGIFLAFMLTRVYPKAFSRAFLTGTLIFIGLNLVAGLAGHDIDNAGHAGGLISGFAMGLLLTPFYRRVQGEGNGLVGGSAMERPLNKSY